VYGSTKIIQILNTKNKRPINHKRMEHIMPENDIKSKVQRNL